jgi:hypothetical protein
MVFSCRRVDLITRAGLANRLRSIDSAINFANILGARLAVSWPSNEALAGRYEDIFEPTEKFSVTSDTRRKKSSWVDKLFSGLGLSKTISEGLLQKPVKVRTNAGGENLYLLSLPVARLRPWCLWYTIETDHAFCYPEDYTWLMPVAPIRDVIGQFTTRLGPECVGVHIRRGDHAQAIAKSPLSAFLREMDARLQSEARSKFYLATDDNQVRREMVDAFGSAIVCQHEVSERQSLDGVRQAVVDLFCLAHCHQIWGSVGSSFTELAFHIGVGDLYMIEGDGRRLVRRQNRCD